MTSGDHSLTVGLRTLTTLARYGSLDIAILTRLEERSGVSVTKVVSELEREGFVRLLTESAQVQVTSLGAAIAESRRAQLH